MLSTAVHNIMVIDDDVDALESMVAALSAAGYVVSTAISGEEAINMLPRGCAGGNVPRSFVEALRSHVAGATSGGHLMRYTRRDGPDSSRGRS